MNSRYMLKEHEMFDMEDSVMVIKYKDGVLDLENVAYLSDVSLQIWNFLKEGMMAQDIINHIAEKYDVDKDIVENDVNECISDLISADFIECI